ncbi:hypothetical protein [Magnetospira sp. QH-2]|uniref:hypothetical protein n=1 Tax=Magnetospira sp. (strain QH-2) TaxID=1288970 RepID=UPI0003E80CB6|nr:hypothetical protein [Magnetospira sp. QH-2]CCQ74896.1 conserved exported protein of unknown function [Magnetospira sp. QH-2]
MTQLRRINGIWGAAAVLGLIVGSEARAAEPNYAWYKEIYEPGDYLFNYSIFDDWDIHYDSGLAYEAYPLSGNTSLGPYQDTGSHGYYEFNLVGTREYSPFHRLRTQFSGVYNLSDYRHREYGFVPERISILKENGESKIPNRLELGNFYGEFTNRTLQTSLKGGSVELQPTESWRGEQHSVQLLAASGVTRWDRDNFNDDFYFGGSWLVDATRIGANQADYGTWSVNWVRNLRPKQPLEGFINNRTQDVFSIAGSKDFTGPMGHQLTLEGEMAAMTGDHELNSDDSLDRDQFGQGTFFQLTGSAPNIPLDYRARFETNTNDFAPLGASSVTSDFKGTELHGGWRFEKGVRMRLRDTRYRTAESSGNQTQTITDGVTFTGPLLTYFKPEWGNVTGALDLYRRRTADSTIGTQAVLRVADLNLNTPLPRDWTGRFGFKLQDNHNIITQSTLLSKEISLSADHAMTFRKWSGTVTPGLILRTADGQDVDNDDYQPSVGFNLTRGNETLNANFGFYYQNAKDSGDTDTVDWTFSGAYAYNMGPHVFRLEADYLNRDIDLNDNTDQTRVAFVWRYNYDKPSKAAEEAAAARALTTAPLSGTGSDIRVGSIALGSPAADAFKLLADDGFGSGASQSGANLYESQMIPSLSERQRLVVLHEGGKVTGTGAIIEFDDTTNVAGMQRSYARVLADLLALYGSPTEIYEDGFFMATIATDLRNGTFRRIVEWQRDGQVIRFGVPRRLDNDVRMEIVNAPSFPAKSQPVWGLTNIK